MSRKNIHLISFENVFSTGFFFVIYFALPDRKRRRKAIGQERPFRSELSDRREPVRWVDFFKRFFSKKHSIFLTVNGHFFRNLLSAFFRTGGLILAIFRRPFRRILVGRRFNIVIEHNEFSSATQSNTLAPAQLKNYISNTRI